MAFYLMYIVIVLFIYIFFFFFSAISENFSRRSHTGRRLLLDYFSLFFSRSLSEFFDKLLMLVRSVFNKTITRNMDCMSMCNFSTSSISILSSFIFFSPSTSVISFFLCYLNFYLFIFLVSGFSLLLLFHSVFTKNENNFWNFFFLGGCCVRLFLDFICYVWKFPKV